MRNSSRPIPGFLPLSLVFTFVVLTLATARAQAPDKDRIWTTIGSAGTVDGADVGKVFFDKSKVQMGRVAVIGGMVTKRRAIVGQLQSAVIRYNVAAVDGLFPPTVRGSGPQLTLRYLDTGPNARVVANLVEIDLTSGAETVFLTFDSNGSPAGTGYQTDSIQPRCAGWNFDFQHKAYYIEATLTTKNVPTVGNAAGIQMIKLSFDSCIA
jgi:hypothetical protein